MTFYPLDFHVGLWYNHNTDKQEFSGVFMKRKLEVKGTIIIGDPCELVKSEEDWQLCKWGEHLEKIGLKNFLYIEFEEDAPNIVDSNGNKLGSFCTDSAVIVVLLLDDLLNYNPNFNEHIAYPQNWTIIKDFCGTVKPKTIAGVKHIIGEGNISFHTVFEEE